MFRVTTNITGPTYYLTRTTWTSELARAGSFATREAAQAAIERARQFNPKAAKTARIIEVAAPSAGRLDEQPRGSNSVY